ncbi:MAG: zinc-binding dehydrogenase [Verrucomicrobia bacterium]|nr:zinc-binding dehydrogenase [Verrucomicrobiota bacterium]MCG2679169.1 zinc-binding dehydrogenase [Kiritimatiellia bacterium]MBU4247903.1 zinc-binding dehydrogenase [Verrucomicrobiota bacterium]MBU4291281.1 zinc-binding dehydrogenase [Verrucomicrobiota bacterium]MBU4429469.1 zinc-binding dehydrogenase [Verrucomicrobiota bacterium]
MKKIVITGQETIQLRETEAIIPKDDEALIEVRACGICGSEMGPYHAEPNGEKDTGHEAAGIVAVPGKSGLLKQGDRVVLCAVSGCGECEYCRTGHENYCPDIWSKGRPFRPFAHAEKLALVERNCLKIPDNMDFETAVTVGGCGIGVAWHGIKRLDVHKDEPVLVFGVGPIGLAAIVILRKLGAQPIAIDVSEYRLNLAAKLGAAEMIKSQPGDDSGMFVAELKKKKNARAILCTGNHQAASQALLSLAPLGRLLVLGGLSQYLFDSFSLIGVGDKMLVGSWHYHRSEWPEILELAAGLPVKDMITHVLPLSKSPEAYRMFANGETGKVILRTDGANV